jgi:cytochrome P450
MAAVAEHSPELDGFLGLLHFAADPLGVLEEARRLHGPFVTYRQGPQVVYLAFSAELTDELLVKCSDRLEKDQFTKALRPILGLGLLTNEGASWKKQRKLLAPSFQPRHIERFAELMVDTTAELTATLGDDEVRSAHHDMMGLTLEIVLRALFGTNAVRGDEIGRWLEIIMDDYRRLTMSYRAAFPWFPFLSRIRFGRMRNKLRAVALEVIQRRRQAPLTDDMLSRLLEARDDAGVGMSDEQLVDECLTVMLAGHETTALALGFALHTLANRPKVRAQVTEELDRVLGGRKATLADVPSLTVTRAVVKETLRLYPPAWAAGREAMADFTLGGVPIKKGQQVVVSPWVVHRDPAYFKEPHDFRPERWWNGETDALPKGAYFPFGAGPRVCIGQHFAELEALFALATLLSSHEVIGSAHPELRFSPSVTLRPADDISLHFRRRARAGQPPLREAS